MQDLLDIAFAPANIFLTLMCIVVVLYWLLVIFAGLDPDFFSIEFDTASTPEVTTVEVDQPNAKNASGGEGQGFMMDVLRFFHFDELPVVFILTLVFLSMWLMSVNVTWYLGIKVPLLGILLYIPYFIVSLFVVKLFARPLVHLYKLINHKGEEQIDFLGRRCTVINDVAPGRMGTIELVVNQDPIKLYAKSSDGNSMKAGDEVIIVNESKDKKYFYVEKFDY